MDEKSNISTVLEAFGCEIFLTSGDWIVTNCPFSEIRHAKGKDFRPSFAFNEEFYLCHACQLKGNLTNLAFELSKTFNQQYREIKNLLLGSPENQVIKAITAKNKPKQKFYEIPLFDIKPNVFDESLLENYSNQFSDEAKQYLERRKLNFECYLWNSVEQRIVIVQRDFNFSLVGISGRSISENIKPKYKNIAGSDKDKFLYGEHEINFKNKTCIIVEGQFDRDYITGLGYENVLAVMGSSISDFQCKKLITFFNRAIYFPDGDDPGLKAKDKFFEKLKSHLLIDSIHLKEEHFSLHKDPNDMTEDEIRSYLDPLLNA